MKKFRDCAVGVFFTCATVIMVGFSYLVYTQWQEVWSKGFDDFRSISGAIVHLEQTAQPLSNVAPDILVQMKQMQVSIADMKKSMKDLEQTATYMGTTMYGLHTSVRAMSFSVPRGMGRMENQLSPWNMMNPFR